MHTPSTTPSSSTGRPRCARDGATAASADDAKPGATVTLGGIRVSAHTTGAIDSTASPAHASAPNWLATTLPLIAPTANAPDAAACIRISTGRPASRSSAVPSVFIARSTVPAVRPSATRLAVSASGEPAANSATKVSACSTSTQRINRRTSMRRSSRPPTVIAPT